MGSSARRRVPCSGPGVEPPGGCEGRAARAAGGRAGQVHLGVREGLGTGRGPGLGDLGLGEARLV